jgi:hypothetical protein
MMWCFQQQWVVVLQALITLLLIVEAGVLLENCPLNTLHNGLMGSNHFLNDKL